MRKILSIIIVATLFSCSNYKVKLEYPMTKKVDTVDVYFGNEVPDPYRWLEDDNSEETKAWVIDQNKATEAYLATIPYRDKVKSRLTKLLDYPKISAPFKKGGNYFVFKNDGLQNQDVVYMKTDLDGDEEVILDPNILSDDGTVALTHFSPSPKGKYVAYGISRGGSDWNEFFVIDLDSKEHISDHIKWSKFSSIAWYNNGFYYARYPEPVKGDELKGVNEHSKIYYHTIGTKQDQDQLIYEDNENPDWGFDVKVSTDQKILFVTVTKTTKGNALYVKKLDTGDEIFKLIEDFNSDYFPIDHVDGKILLLTDNGAPKYKVVAIDDDKLRDYKWYNVIPENEQVLQGADLVGGKIIASYIKDAHSHVEVFSLKGECQYDIEFPVLGTVSGFSGNLNDDITFYTLTSFTIPSQVFKYHVKENASELYQEADIDFDADNYITKQVFYTSKDGTKVPMFIVHKNDIELDGSNPVLLYGYGGFNISLTPRFSSTRLAWLEQGGVFCYMNLRGGGEYGEHWHQAGTKMKKQNVFDDCIAAAEYLISENYTSKGKIALQGGSNGGLLVGAVINQRPDLFGAALPAVGVMDMLRYHKFTIGRYWAADYGTSDDSEEMFNYLMSYSPLHTIKSNVEYPSVLVTTADHDDRVVPAHSFKYIATLQEKYQGNNPAIIRIETNAGHGAGKPTSMIIDEYTDVYSFLFNELNVDVKY